MASWLQQAFQENTILWLFLSSVVGGIIGASTKFIFDVVLPQRVQRGREAIIAKRKYASPILHTAIALRDRAENIIKNIHVIEEESWFPANDNTEKYYYMSTLFVVGQFFGWVQILRQTIVFLDFTTTTETQKFEGFLTMIENGFTNPSLLTQAKTGIPKHSKDKWIHKYQLQAIAASMIARDDHEYRIIDYATFCKMYTKHSDNDFKDWFFHLSQLFLGLKADDERLKRITKIGRAHV